ncbi:MAG: molybdopterin-dependent oxidoreductase, partial [Actinomycetota bacterium]|nr:molybdopterin-dependent oxidoreductase [Actinomycetota bacterium]
MTVTDENPGYKWVGTRQIRPDGVDKVTGKARFGADLTLPGMLYGRVVRSPHAHARIVSIDTSAAEAMPGVYAVITGADFPDLAAEGAKLPDIQVAANAIARDKVLYEGHPVAAVAATTRELANAAADAVVVNYEALPHVLTVDQAMADDAVLLHEGMITANVDPKPEKASNVAARTAFDRGDLEQGYGEADLVIEREFDTKPVHQGYIEPHAAVADCGQDGRATVWCSSQGHFAMRSMSCTVLGWDTGR